MATYSILNTTPIETIFLGNLYPSLFLSNLPNNTSQRILPSDLRNALFTIWDNISFKQISSTSSNSSYIGIGGKSHMDNFRSGDGLKMLIGKSKLSTDHIMNDDMLDYSKSDTDIFIYNLKPDNYRQSDPSEQFTKMSFLAGDNRNDTLFSRAPYLKAQHDSTGNKIDFTISNENGKIIIDADDITIGSGTNSITIGPSSSINLGAKPAGPTGSIQLNLDGCYFDYVMPGQEGDLLLLGPDNKPYWSSLNINDLMTLNQVLGAGNTSDGKDIIISDGDSIYLGGTGSSHSSLTYDSGVSSFNTDGEFHINANNPLSVNNQKLKINIKGINPNKILKTDQHGYAYWGDPSQSTITPHGGLGDIQVKGFDGVSLDSISGGTASVGHVLTMGASNTPYWGTQSGGNLGDVYEEEVGLTMDHPAIGTVIGDTQQDYNSKNNAIIEALINNVDPPDYTEPTTNISLSNITREIGSSNVRTITNSFVQNDAGALVSQRIYKNSIEVSDTGSYNETGIVATGSTVYRGEVTYDDGPIKENAIGIPDPRNKIDAGTINTGNRTITGILPYYWKEFDVMPDLDNLNISSFNKVVASSSGKITLTMNIVSKHLVILIPNGSTTKTKWEITPLNAGDIGAGNLILSPVIKTISSHQNYWSNESYKVYVTGYLTSISPKIDLIN